MSGENPLPPQPCFLFQLSVCFVGSTKDVYVNQRRRGKSLFVSTGSLIVVTYYESHQIISAASSSSLFPWLIYALLFPCGAARKEKNRPHLLHKRGFLSL